MHTSNEPKPAMPSATPSGSSIRSAADEPTHVSDVPHTPRPPTESGVPQIDGFEMHEEVHRGGQGVVYRATQAGTRRTVALKVLLDGAFASEVARLRFEREVELAASLRHPSIVTVLSSGIAHGRFYFAMEYIDGWRLDQFLRQQKPDFEATLKLFVKICDAVNFAHQRGVIHRDLKPSNILVDREHNPRLLDFGLAKADKRSDPRETTVAMVSTTGQVLGTLAYMSPEQAAGSIDVDVRSDVYSLGVMFYEGLLGCAPYSVDGPLGEVLSRIASEQPTNPRLLRSASRFGKQITEDLGTVLLKALEKEPNRRYQTAGELGRDVQHLLDGEPIEAQRASGLYMLKQTLKRYKLQAGAAGIILAMLIVFLISFAVLYRKESFARTVADDERAKAREAATAAENAARVAADAERRASADRERAERAAAQANRNAEELRGALVQQKLQRADLAQLRGDLAEARDNYWDAYRLAPDNAASLWELREYYMTSGDVGSSQLFLRSVGPTAISPDGSIAAVIEASDGITVRSLDNGLTVAWLAVPGTVSVVDIDDCGAVVAAGEQWTAYWPPGSMRPSSIARIVGGPSAVSVHYLSTSSWAVVYPNTVRRFSTGDGGTVEVALKSNVAAPAVFSKNLGQLAVPTKSGVELIGMNGPKPTSEQIWRADDGKPPRAVRFVDDELLGVLADSLQLTFVVGEQRGQTLTHVADVREWSDFDLKRGIGVVALGSADGRVAIYRSGQRSDGWQISQGALRLMRLTPDGDILITLDDRGSLTRWARGQLDQQRRRISSAHATRWAVSEDRSTLLYADDAGRVFAYSPQRSREPMPVPLPSLINMISGGSATEMSLSLSRDGQEAVIRSDDRIWFKTLARPRAQAFRWNDADTPKLRDTMLSGDGKLLAILSETATGDRQVVSFHRPGRLRQQTGANISRSALLTVGTITEFVGSTVRAMTFAPNGEDLFVARSNGAIILVQPNAPTSGPGGPTTRELARNVETAWAVLDSAAYALTLDAAGKYLAAACDDGVVRVLGVLDTSEQAAITVPQRVSSMSFSPSQDVLLIRLDDGRMLLHDVRTGALLARWDVTIGKAAALASWIGKDSIVVSGGDGINELQFRMADELIQRNRAYATEREIARKTATGDAAAAWNEAAAIETLDAKRAREVRAEILDAFLRRGRIDVPGAWVEASMADAPPGIVVRLAHAAFEGARFELAHDLFEKVAKAERADLDDRTLWRAAECEYLVGDAAAAARQLAALRGRPAMSDRDQSRLTIEHVAALVRAGRLTEADAEARKASGARRMGERDLLPYTAMNAIVNLLTNPSANMSQSAAYRALTTLFPTQWVEFRDDIEFFAGEAELARGRIAEARIRYQRCIDTARDAWPVEWARLRLRQTEAKTGKAAAQ
ncbi:MAG: WD40 repeat domain-containing serine/threonine protein kinase [Phycisphaerae bacterium]